MLDDAIGLSFPCVFPIKIMGHHGDDFESAVLNIIHQHFPTLREDAIHTKLSKNEKYASITVEVNANSKAQLDALYQELTAHQAVLYAL